MMPLALMLCTRLCNTWSRARSLLDYIIYVFFVERQQVIIDKNPSPFPFESGGAPDLHFLLEGWMGGWTDVGSKSD